MFKFLRTVAEALGRVGLKVMTIGVRADWLFCDRGFKASWRQMLRTRFTSLFSTGGPHNLSVKPIVIL